MRRWNHDEPKTLGEALSELTVSELKPLVAMIGPKTARKEDLVRLLAKVLLDPQKLRELYAGLDEMNQRAVQEATHHEDGKLDEIRFRAKYGRTPDHGGQGRFYRDEKPTTLRLFFPRYNLLPVDVRQLLLAFVPPPPPLTIQMFDEIPAKVKRPHVNNGSYYKPDEEEVDLRIRQTTRAAVCNLQAMLRLVDAGEVRVGEKTGRPSDASMKTIVQILTDGDFYAPGEIESHKFDAVQDFNIQAFAWALLLQAGGLAKSSAGRLQLTPTGRKATARPAHETIRGIWEKWLDTKLLDEFNRIEVIKGQKVKGRGSLTAVAPRRHTVVDVLQECPSQKWITIEEFFRLIKARGESFLVSQSRWSLYICELRYGSLGYDSDYSWEMLQGRFTLAFLFEYAATLGLIDVAYISPMVARNDYRGCWGTDDLSCLSRYDGLMFMRINALGAWCLGLAENYEAEVISSRSVLKVLPNLDVVASATPLSRGDILFLERFAERSSDAVWHLETAKILEAVEAGLTVAELADFLKTNSQEPLPQTVAIFLQDLQTKADQLADQGSARLIACKDAFVAQTLVNDRRLRKFCQLAGDRLLVFRAGDENAVRRALRELGYVLPPAR
jgi:hypothetical protein